MRVVYYHDITVQCLYEVCLCVSHRGAPQLSGRGSLQSDQPPSTPYCTVALQPKIEKLSTLEALNSIKLQQLLQHQNSEASGLTAGICNCTLVLMEGGGDREF